MRNNFQPDGSEGLLNQLNWTHFTTICNTDIKFLPVRNRLDGEIPGDQCIGTAAYAPVLQLFSRQACLQHNQHSAHQQRHHRIGNLRGAPWKKLLDLLQAEKKGGESGRP